MAPPRVHTRCPWCGLVELLVSELTCSGAGPGEDRGLCQFTCPECSRPVFVAVSPSDVALLWTEGAGEGCLPLELLEPHSGPPLSWDDLLDFHLALDEFRPAPSDHRSA